MQEAHQGHVERKDIDDRFGEKIKRTGLRRQRVRLPARQGAAQIVERRFQKEVGDQVKSEVLLASLQQLAEDHDIAPLERPDIDPANIEMPRQGPLVYEFEVEVRPQFDLPNYKGLKIRRPIHTFTEEEVVQEERRLLTPYGQIVPKPEGDAQIGDLLVADAVVKAGDREIGKFERGNLPRQ